MVSVSISHSDFIFIPPDFFAQIYLYWPPHRISHFQLASQPLYAVPTSCCTNTQRGYKRPRAKTPGTCIQSSFKISTEVVSVTATKHVTGLEIKYSSFIKTPEVQAGAQHGRRSPGCWWWEPAGRWVSGCRWSGSPINPLLPLYRHFFFYKI